jgi:hypothetical protein
MAKITVMDNEYCTLWYYPDKKIVHHKVKKFIFGQTFYNMLLAGTDLIIKNHATKWLSDDVGVPVLKQEDMDWGAANWFPQTVKGGWKYWAIMVPDQPMGKMNLEALAAMYGKMGVTARFFKSFDEAMKWLESC